MNSEQLIFEQRRRQRLRSIIVLLVIGGLLYTGARLLGYFVFRPFLRFIDPDFLAEGISVLGFFVLMLAVGHMLNLYLRYGPSYFRAPKAISEDLEKNDESIIEQLTDRVAALEAGISSNDYGEHQYLSPDEKLTLAQEVASEVRKSASDILLSNIEKKVSEYHNAQELKDLKNRHELMLKRLVTQVDQLSRRGNLNLIVGILATLSGFLIFWYMLPDLRSEVKEPIDLFAQFAPRLSLVLLIEIFAYFFLNLYKSSLAEIKYFQNELTNVEAKLIALEYATIGKSDTTLKKILEILAATERNFVLKKGETTVQLEQDRVVLQGENTLLARLEKLLDKKPKHEKAAT